MTAFTHKLVFFSSFDLITLTSANILLLRSVTWLSCLRYLAIQRTGFNLVLQSMQRTSLSTSET